MSEHIKAHFENMNELPARLEKKYNPEKKNLHFAAEAIRKSIRNYLIICYNYLVRQYA